MATNMDLGYYYRRFPDALQERYRATFDEGFKDIEDRYKKVRSGSRPLTVEDVLAIFHSSLPFIHDWTKPDREDLSAKMNDRDNKVSFLIQKLNGRRDYDLELVTEILHSFRELSLTALVLHHVYPDRFAMCSHHLASLLHITGPTVAKYYIEYCRELKVWSEREWTTRCKLRVVDAEFALWTWYRLTNFGKEEERKKHRNSFYKDSWVQERRSQQIASALGEIGKLELAHSYLATAPTIAAMIAWRELETAMRKILRNRGEKTTQYRFRDLLRSLPPDALPRNLTKNDLEDLWSRRNPVLHEGEEIAKEKAIRRIDSAKVLHGVRQFIEKNASELTLQ